MQYTGELVPHSMAPPMLPYTPFVHSLNASRAPQPLSPPPHPNMY